MQNDRKLSSALYFQQDVLYVSLMGTDQLQLLIACTRL